jgi:NADPH-ferrihemoprotein reductase
MATYGEGDPTDNAQEFYNWLQNGESDLTGVKFAVGSPLIIMFL